MSSQNTTESGINTNSSHHSASEALTRLVADARRHEAGVFADDDIEHLHRYRVLLRRARSVLAVLDGVLARRDAKAIRRGIKAAAKRTNRLRDLDVHLEARAAQEARVAPALRGGLASLFAAVEVARGRELDRVTAVLASEDYAREMEALADAIRAAPPRGLAARPLRGLVEERLQDALDELLARGRTITTETPDAQVHALRLDCKRVRYTLDFAGDVFGRRAIKPLLKRLKALQDVLGVFNDLTVQQEALLVWLSSPAAERPRTAAAAGALIQALYLEQQELRAHAVQGFEAFDSPELVELVRAVAGRSEEGG